MGAAPLPLRLGHVGITTAASVEGTAYYGQGQPLQPTPALPSEAQQWAVGKFLRALVPPLNPLARQREMGWGESAFPWGACSPTLCLGHFKVKFSSMNVQPVSKEKFLWQCRVGWLPVLILSTQVLLRTLINPNHPRVQPLYLYPDIPSLSILRDFHCYVAISRSCHSSSP